MSTENGNININELALLDTPTYDMLVPSERVTFKYEALALSPSQTKQTRKMEILSLTESGLFHQSGIGGPLTWGNVQ